MQSEEWVRGRRYLDMRKLEERCREERESEEVMLIGRYRKLQKLRDLNRPPWVAVHLQKPEGFRERGEKGTVSPPTPLWSTSP